MSSKAVGWVFEHSPYDGAALLVHLALADVENDTHDHELWLAAPKIAKKARVSLKSVQRALATMVAEGFLELIDPELKPGPGKPLVYRFLFPTMATVAIVPIGVTRIPNRGHLVRQPRTSGAARASSLELKKDPKDPKARARRSPRQLAIDDLEALARQAARAAGGSR